MSIREFLDALRSTQGQHTLASVLEGPESGARLLLCEGVPVWPARPEGLLPGISRRWPGVVQAAS